MTFLAIAREPSCIDGVGFRQRSVGSEEDLAGIGAMGGDAGIDEGRKAGEIGRFIGNGEGLAVLAVENDDAMFIHVTADTAGDGSGIGGHGRLSWAGL